MRVAHVTDIHVLVPPSVGECFNKRALGAANLYLAGRKSHFTRDVQEALVGAVLGQKPDVLACTGDLTAMATDAEFQEAFGLLEPMFQAQPSVLIPGNHDTYVRQAELERSIEKWFGAWTGQGEWPRLHRHGDVAFVCIDVCRSAWILSSGRADDDQLARLDRMLDELDAAYVFVLLHYPLRGRHGEPYGPWTRNVENAAQVEAVLSRHASKLGAILHGHEHHGFRTELPSSPPVPILNPGSSGYADLPDKGRRAHFCVYTVEGGQMTGIERFAFDGTTFSPEPGGAWASGG